jgi:uncharacterized protein YndB with AHSA1/START domain
MPTSEFRTSIEIDAPPDIVFEHLVTAEGMVAWLGQHADLEPRPGGGFAVDCNGAAIRGRFLVVERPHRVVVSWGMAGSENLPPGMSRVEFTLTPVGRGTRLDLVHSGLPETRARNHRQGWGHFLPRLAIVAAGGTAVREEPDSWWRPNADSHV